MKTEITNWIINTLIDKYGVNQSDISPSSVYEDLDLDSLTLIEITAKLEKAFNLKVPCGQIHSELSIDETADRLIKCAA